MVKSYFKKKRLWEATLALKLDIEIQTFKHFIKSINGPNRLKYDGML
jgi:hypothetical protein